MLRRSNGWIHTLLEEAENERMHLLTFLTLKEKNNLIFRTMVIGGQVCILACPLLHPMPIQDAIAQDAIALAGVH